MLGKNEAPGENENQRRKVVMKNAVEMVLKHAVNRNDHKKKPLQTGLKIKPTLYRNHFVTITVFFRINENKNRYQVIFAELCYKSLLCRNFFR